MKLIDFDGAFEAYLQDWFMRSKGLFRTYDEMEDQVPEVYQTFLDTPADFLDGQKPGEYFERFSDPDELTRWMVDYEKAGVPVPDMLLNRISELGALAEPGLTALLTRTELPAAARMNAVTLLREVGSEKPADLYIRWVQNFDGRDELTENALESLQAMGGNIRKALLSALPEASDEGKAAILSILSENCADERAAEIAIDLFERRRDLQAQLASVLGRLGSEKALPALRRAALDEENGYLVYIELRNAIEQLGEEAPERSFSEDDPEYASLRDLEK